MLCVLLWVGGVGSVGCVCFGVVVGKCCFVVVLLYWVVYWVVVWVVYVVEYDVVYCVVFCYVDIYVVDVGGGVGVIGVEYLVGVCFYGVVGFYG